MIVHVQLPNYANSRLVDFTNVRDVRKEKCYSTLIHDPYKNAYVYASIHDVGDDSYIVIPIFSSNYR